MPIRTPSLVTKTRDSILLFTIFSQFRFIVNLEGRICLAFPHLCRRPWSRLFVLGSRIEAGRNLGSGSSIHSCGVQILSTGFVVSLDNQYGHWETPRNHFCLLLIRVVATTDNVCSSRQKHASLRRKELIPSTHLSFHNGLLLVTWQTECNGTRGRTYRHVMREWFPTAAS